MFRKPFAEMHFSQAGMQCAANMERQAQGQIKRGDVYTYIASLMFGVPKENITPAMRQAAKKRVYWELYS